MNKDETEKNEVLEESLEAHERVFHGRSGVFMKTLYLSISLILTAVVASAHGSSFATQDRKLIRIVSSFRLIDSNVRYDGVETTAGDACTHYDALPYRGRNYYWSDAMSDGLFVDGGSAPSKIYQPYDLAERAGWFVKRDDLDFSNNLWGLFQSGGRIWMGTVGLGILVFDPQRRMWSRYDSQVQARPDAMTFLYSIDEKFIFFYRPGGLFVYSWKHRSCAELSRPLDHRIDAGGYKNGSVYFRFRSAGEKAAYYAELEREFSRLKR